MKTPYIKLHNDLLTDPKILRATPGAFALWVKGLIYANQNLTDGFVPESAVKMLANGSRSAAKVQRELLDLCLWVQVIGGYSVGEGKWSKYQTTSQEIENKRLAEAKRKREWRETHQCPTGQSPDEKVAERTADRQTETETETETEIRLKEPPISPTSGGNYSEDFETFWKSYPRRVGKGAAWKTWQAAKKSKTLPAVEILIAAVTAAAKTEQWTSGGGKYIPHPATWLTQRRWEDEAPEAEPEDVQPDWDAERKYYEQLESAAAQEAATQ
jgi:hypothetical protein